METNKQHIIDELKKNQPELPGNDFFEGIKADLLERIASEEPAPIAKVIPLYRKMWFVATVAAAITLLIVLPVLWQNPAPQTPQQANVTWEDVSRDELLAYIDDHIADFDEDMLAQHLDSIPHWKTTTSITYYAGRAEKHAMKKTAKKSQNLFEDVEKEEILEYLEEEAIDLDDEFF